MSALPEDDAPTMLGTAGDRHANVRVPLETDVDDDGEDPTAAAARPPVAAAQDPGEADEEDRTIQQMVAPPPPEPRKPPPVPRPSQSPPSKAPPAPVAARPAAAATAARPARPAPPVRPASPPVAVIAEGAADLSEDPESLDDSVTTTAPRVDAAGIAAMSRSARGLPLTLPGRVEISTLAPADPVDETEVRTRPGHVPLAIPATLRADVGRASAAPAPAPAPRPAAGRPPSSSNLAAAPYHGGADEPDEPPTRPGVEGAHGLAALPVIEGAVEPPTRPGVAELETSPGIGDAPAPRRALGSEASKLAEIGAAEGDEDDDDEGPTARGKVVAAADDGDSVTTQAPAVPHSVVEAASRGSTTATPLDDTTGATTKKVPLARLTATSSPADGEVESITTQAPGPLTNILRVIAADSNAEIGGPEIAPLEDDEPPENHTAVMANAPLQQMMSELERPSGVPPIRPTGGPLHFGAPVATAPRVSPSSESGLRVARPGASGDERASLGRLAPMGDVHGGGFVHAPGSLAPDGGIHPQMESLGHANTEMAFPAVLHDARPMGEEPGVEAPPRYGLLVGVVAAISVLVPITLFLVLRQGPEEGPRLVPAEPASEVQEHDAPRARAVRGRNGVMSPPPSSSSAGGRAAPRSGSSPRR